MPGLSWDARPHSARPACHTCAGFPVPPPPVPPSFAQARPPACPWHCRFLCAPQTSCGSQCVPFHCARRFDTRARHREPRSCVRCPRRCPRPRKRAKERRTRPRGLARVTYQFLAAAVTREHDPAGVEQRAQTRSVVDPGARCAAALRGPTPRRAQLPPPGSPGLALSALAPAAAAPGPQPPWPRGLGLLSPAGGRRGGGGVQAGERLRGQRKPGSPARRSRAAMRPGASQATDWHPCAATPVQLGSWGLLF